MQAGISGEPAVLIPERHGRRLRQDGEGGGLARAMGGLTGRMCGQVGRLGGEGGGEEDWRCEKGPSPLICSLKLVSLLLLTPSPPKHTYTEKFYLYMDRHTQTEKHTQTAISKGFSPFIQNF